MNKNSLLYYTSALSLKLPITYDSATKRLHLSLGGNNYYFIASITPLNDASSIYLAKNKFALNQLLDNAGFPVPKCVAIQKSTFMSQSLPTLMQGLNFPVVVKPMRDTHSGNGVSCNITTQERLTACLNEQFKIHPSMQVEEFHQGLREYRILLLKNRVIGVLEFISPSIEGDGQHTIEQLIEYANQSITVDCFPIPVNDDCQQCLADQDVTLDHILPKGKKIRLHYTSNRTLGGRAISLGNKLHAENKRYLCRAARVIGLDLVGLDVLCEDINRPFSKTKWIILEANFGPSVTIHECPDEGIAVNVSKKIVMQFIYRHPFAYLFHRMTQLWGLRSLKENTSNG